ncbi:thermonuclease family protein [Psittacicella hinzii]|uniref:TNase-like domain-containing protein n=1 Tax=Psittacicella hinzii TaxID=2028575 RepID=A0A3A1YNJ0_9GAMM|nr:thermonuclease family protein [Psittacicella hinzii]RIY39843.1 hypothetical protein CKF58_01370 [Psittacicella hinzii]
MNLSVKFKRYLLAAATGLCFVSALSTSNFAAAAPMSATNDYSAFGDRGGPGGNPRANLGHDPSKAPGRVGPGYNSNPVLRGNQGRNNPAARDGNGRSSNFGKTSVYASNPAFARSSGFNNFVLYNNSSIFTTAGIVVSFMTANSVGGSSNPVVGMYQHASTGTATTLTSALSVDATTATTLADDSLNQSTQAAESFNSFVAQNQLPSCLVTEVFSGDTFSCYFAHLDATRIVKLYGINAVASSYAYNASALVANSILNKRVVVQALSTYNEPSVQAVVYWEGLNLNYRMLQVGAAQVNTNVADNSSAYKSFIEAQAQAKSQSLGQWHLVD